jgi:RNA polymerase sigma-70 factor (ECF subfamily)
MRAVLDLRPDMVRESLPLNAYERGRAAWPDVHVSQGDFVAHVQRLQADDEHAEDLFLALGCAMGDQAAIASFEQRYVSEVPRYLARIDASPLLVDDARQWVRDFLLVATDGAQPRIADYAGRGALGGWVRVIATRFVLQIKRREARASDSDADAAARLAASEPGPEVALVRARHGRELAAALKASIEGLPPKERGLVKLAIVDELTIDQLSGLYDVHRSTIARWIARLKEQIFESAVADLRQRLQLDTAGVESLCRALRSQLEFSLSDLLEP